jgi:hypothetical protein
MDTTTHSMAALFSQLGLENSEIAINNFIKQHKGIPADLPLAQAPFWSQAQGQFLREALTQDSDWSDWVDHLDSQLR